MSLGNLSNIDDVEGPNPETSLERSPHQVCRETKTRVSLQVYKSHALPHLPTVLRAA